MSDYPPPAGGAAQPRAGDCPRCGAAVRPGQDWCLNCGLAVTTEVGGAAGWRTPIAIVAAVLLVAAVALVLAFVELSGEADQAAQVPAATPIPVAPLAPAATPAGPSGLTGPTGPTGAGGTGPSGPGSAVTPAPGATSQNAIGSWPKGKTAFTVILFSETSRSSAKAKAKTVTSLPDVGILRSGDYPSLRSGFFVVFSNQYDSIKAAQSAAERAQSQAPGAYAKEVVPK